MLKPLIVFSSTMKLWKLLIWTKYLVEIREMVFEKKYFEMFLAYFYYVAIISPWKSE